MVYTTKCRPRVERQMPFGALKEGGTVGLLGTVQLESEMLLLISGSKLVPGNTLESGGMEANN